MHVWLTDFRYGVRSLRKAPRFTVTAVLLLSAGIGLSTSIFTFVHALLLKPMPYPDGERFVLLSGVRKGENGPVSLEEIRDWQQQSSAFVRICAVSTSNQNYTLFGAKNPERVLVAQVSANFFDVFQPGAVLGRGFVRAEDSPSGSRSVVLSYDLWRRAFKSDRGILGKTIRLNEADYAVAGVLRERFVYPEGTDAWISADQIPMLRNRRVRGFNAIGVLKASASLRNAETETDLLAKRLESAYPESNTDWRIRLMRLQDFVAREFRVPLLFVFGAAALVLLVCCANATNLMLARGIARSREFAIQLSLGAGPAALFRQLAAELLILSLAAATIGILVAHWAIRGIGGLSSGNLPRLQEVRIDWPVLGFAIAVSLLTTAIAAAILASRIAGIAIGNLAHRAGQLSPGAAGHRLRNSLAAAEIALSLVLVSAFGIAIESLFYLTKSNMGLEPREVLTVRAGLPTTNFGATRRMRTFFDQARDRIAVLPGVAAVGLTSTLPFSSDQPGSSFTIEDDPPLPPGTRLLISYQHADPGYFKTMHIRLLKGRTFDRRDSLPGSRLVAMINNAAALRYFGNANPIGRRISLMAFGVPLDVVGVVQDLKHDRVDREPVPQLFLNSEQIPVPAMTFVIRTSRDPVMLAGPVREQLRSLDTEAAIDKVNTLDRVVADSIWEHRLSAVLLTVFAATGLLLSAAGVYAVVSRVLAERTREVGIRIALGARSKEILQAVILRTARLVSYGLAAGIVVAFAVSKLLAGFVFGVHASVAPICLLASALLAAVALAATVPPALRAANTDPSLTLRQE